MKVFFKLLMYFIVCLIVLCLLAYGAHLAGATVTKWSIALAIFFAGIMTAGIAVFQDEVTTEEYLQVKAFLDKMDRIGVIDMKDAAPYVKVYFRLDEATSIKYHQQWLSGK